MKTEQIIFQMKHKCDIVAGIEMGSDFSDLRSTWPELTKWMYLTASCNAIQNLNQRYFSNRDVIKTVRDIKLFLDLVSNGAFDLSSVQVAECLLNDVESVLQSGVNVFSESGFWTKGEERLTTVSERELIEINTCLHFIKHGLQSSKSRCKIGSYGMKHKVEKFTRIAHKLNPAYSPLYISNVSFIIAAILSGIRTEKDWNGRNAVFWMKSATGSGLFKFVRRC